VRPDRRRQTGRLGERIAAERLERLGYTVIEQNHRSREGEIDLIATRKGVLVFCEVKTLVRRGLSHQGPAFPLEAVGPAKRAQVRRLARAWLGARPQARRWRAVRLDAIGVSLSPEGELLSIDHVENAF
jgi:putative endonuclease